MGVLLSTETFRRSMEHNAVMVLSKLGKIVIVEAKMDVEPIHAVTQRHVDFETLLYVTMQTMPVVRAVNLDQRAQSVARVSESAMKQKPVPAIQGHVLQTATSRMAKVVGTVPVLHVRAGNAQAVISNAKQSTIQ